VRIARPLAWAVAAGLAVACAVVFESTYDAVVAAAGCAVLVVVTVTDLERRIVPNRVVVPAWAAALVAQTAHEPRAEWLVASLAAGGFFLLFALIYPAGLGMGDVKLAAFLGAWLGWDVAVALFAGTFLAVVPAVVILAREGRSGRKVGIPFAPFLAAGGVVALFAGGRVLDWWLGG
jgi:leader peptidase (prepilin peptidase) / N-methyltransferase